MDAFAYNSLMSYKLLKIVCCIKAVDLYYAVTWIHWIYSGFFSWTNLKKFLITREEVEFFLMELWFKIWKFNKKILHYRCPTNSSKHLKVDRTITLNYLYSPVQVCYYWYVTKLTFKNLVDSFKYLIYWNNERSQLIIL